jgi:hypothetical protein
LKISGELRTAKICRASEYFSVIPEMEFSPNYTLSTEYLRHTGHFKVLSAEFFPKEGNI